MARHAYKQFSYLLELSTLSVSDLTMDPVYEELDWELLDMSVLCFMMDVREDLTKDSR